ncbi:MAG: ABC transporter substrate-binding protein [Deltaproteobacteria bacterium]|nr:ABC transporter substrate-binding protein [Deltaproteobacteria bacterium]MBN2673303.1 ABC transporter substrate-binding protein [Deltaproteobacteria bacterium]
MLAGSVFLLGCGQPQTDQSQRAQKISPPTGAIASNETAHISVMDGIGRQVSLRAPARRIVSLSPGFTETLFEIGCGNQVILRDKWSVVPSEARKLPVTDSVNPSIEAIGGYNPDLVVLYFNDARHVRALAKIGVEAAVFDPKTFEEVATTIETLGVLCGRRDNARAVARDMRSQKKKIEQMAKRVSPIRVYVEIDGTDRSRPWTAGAGSFVDELLRSAGAENVFAYLKKPYAQVNIEEVIAQNPEAILLAGTESERISDVSYILQRPGFSAVEAVREERIINTIDKNILSRPSARLADGLAQLFNALHPVEGAP